MSSIHQRGFVRLAKGLGLSLLRKQTKTEELNTTDGDYAIDEIMVICNPLFFTCP